MTPDFHPEHQSLTPDIGDNRMLVFQFLETRFKVLTGFACLLDESFFFNDVNKCGQHRSGERIKLMAREMTKTCSLYAVCNFIGGNEARDRETAARPFGTD